MTLMEHWRSLKTWQRVAWALLTLVMLMYLVPFHLSWLASTSNRGVHVENNIDLLFSIYRPLAFDTRGGLDAPGRGGDFYAIYEAGHQALIGRPIYQVQPEMNALPRAESRMRAPAVATYRYPPLTAYTLGAALNVLPPERYDAQGQPIPSKIPNAYIVWVLLTEALLLSGVYITLRLASSVGRAFVSTAIWLGFYPMHIEFFMGQFSLLMGWTLLLCGAALATNRVRLAQFAWGLSLFVKAYSALFALYWLWRGPRKMVIAWLAVAVVTTGAYFAVFPSDWAMLWERGVKGRMFAAVEEGEPSAPTLYPGSMGVQRAALSLCRLIDPQRQDNGAVTPPLWSRFVLWLVILGPLPVLAWAATRRNPPPVAVLGLFWLYWFFGYLDTWEHHANMLLPLLALCVAIGLIGKTEGALWFAFLAAPSLWIVMAKLWTVGRADSTLFYYVETLYYLPKAIAVVGLFVSLSLRVRAKG